ncbi:hypothetical protein BFJ69_g9708 [Fusarium oxysporum]|uniref:Uncharacterized protein n=1 Tax=Fusarium oxysporum TaxID=5507 RepID=A0A420MXZ5_FUSOX|nr:hypothetical protein BFJ69_g9708 [Fusarium oxysporum]
MNPSCALSAAIAFSATLVLFFMILHKFGQLWSDLDQHIINAFRNRVATQAT